jgi:hypothetical protein
MVVSSEQSAPWLLLVFSLPATKASQRVQVWRKLKKYGALALRSSGHLLPHSPENLERFEWLATAIRKYRGQASVVQVHSFDDLPSEKITALFVEARSRAYESLMRDLKKRLPDSKGLPLLLPRLRRRFQEIAAIDFFHSPLRSRVEALLAKADAPSTAEPSSASRTRRLKKDYLDRVWVTRPRPGVDRASSAWLIRRFIDSNAKFIFADSAGVQKDAIPFDMFQGGGFGHRGEDCTFETLVKEFVIRDAQVRKIAEIIHDADLGDEKFGRAEGLGIDKILIGWAQQGVADEEILRRGMELFEALYRSVT